MVNRCLALVLLLASATLAGCTSADDGDSLPAARPLVDAAAKELGGLEDVRFQFAVTGAVPGLRVRELTGTADATGDGSAQGEADVQLPDGRTQFEFVLTGDQLTLTEDGQRSDAEVAARFTPPRLFDDETGLGLLLDRASRLRTETSEDVDGVATYRIGGSLGREAATTLFPGIHADVHIKFWIRDGSRRDLIRVWIQVPPRQENEGAAMLELGLSDHNKVVPSPSISAPPSPSR